MASQFNIRTHTKLFCSILLFMTATSCSQQEESEIAKNIKVAMSNSILVLPTSLQNLENYPPTTCVSGGVSGPRVRFQLRLAWQGTDNLVPIAAVISFDDQRLSGAYESVLSSTDAEFESISFMFADNTGTTLKTDYIPAGAIVVTQGCFFDYGGLPTPKEKIKGSGTLEVPMNFMITGVTRDANGLNEKPFVKEARGTVIYSAGSVPVGSN